ncbi:transmembrane protein, putative (macronuclear) [Tetrahymena thermophila SB210]|uniref:Transmembrane protein, putative n=1 Tax=Tetrahymena thermophila (strain SB210) TaxID=312017 RepID=Q236X1_TETTS|nr:transmembrane protein, putative [Tetrahymena thermophila SB210]EAR92379.3 transmembrane protein, putative [Tetrahymena thermophila SB210]|eukprot:XP_001012624.3 transmembrane protein, putative [Tetrahymena thermophila SB210]
MQDSVQSMQVKHFGLTNALIIIVGGLITLGITYQNRLYALFLACLPILFLYMLIEYYLVWKKKWEFTRKFKCFNFLLLLITLPIFLAMYYIFYYESTSYQFQKVENCQVVGKISSNLESNENYSILYVDFEYQGQKLLGYACSSNQNQGKIYEKIRPGIFYNQGDAIPCNKKKNQTEYVYSFLGQDVQSQVSIPTQQTQLQKVYSRIYKNGDCSIPFSFSSVKLPSWYCLEKNFDLEKYMEPQSCYMNLYKEENTALKSGINREILRSSSNFPAITFSNPNYYPQNDLALLIMFVYYPFLISLNLIFSPLAKYAIHIKEQASFNKQVLSSENFTLKSISSQ